MGLRIFPSIAQYTRIERGERGERDMKKKEKKGGKGRRKREKEGTSQSQMQISLKLGGRATSIVDWLRTRRLCDMPRMSNAEDSLRARSAGGVPGADAAVGEDCEGLVGPLRLERAGDAGPGEAVPVGMFT